MGIHVVEFKTERDRTRARVGEGFSVLLEVEWDPFDQGGTEAVALSVEQSGYAVSPRSITITVPTDSEAVIHRFAVVVRGPGGDIVDVVATAPSGSTDSLTIRITE